MINQIPNANLWTKAKVSQPNINNFSLPGDIRHFVLILEIPVLYKHPHQMKFGSDNPFSKILCATRFKSDVINLFR